MITQEKLKELLNYNPEDGLFTWKKRKNGSIPKGSIAGTRTEENEYIMIKVDGKKYSAHRLAWLYIYGSCESGLDHKNRIRSDNRIDNLRELSQSDNCKNKNISPLNTSGVSGVTFDKRYNRWGARINVDLKRIYLGSFATFHEAVDARKNAEVLYGYTEIRGEQDA